jgi:hypothetical protein
MFIENKAVGAGNDAFTDVDCDFENNLFIIISDVATNESVWVSAAAGNSAFYNNIFSGMDTAVYMQGSFDLFITHNVFYNIMTDILNRGGVGMGTDLSFIEFMLDNFHDNHDGDPALVGENVASGLWTADAVFDEENLETVLTDSTASWDEDEFAGALVDVSGSWTYLIILGNTATELRVPGDVTSLVGIGGPYQIDDFHLSNMSPCIDTGLTGRGGAVDFEGDPRPSGYGTDIGPDEFLDFALMTPANGAILYGPPTFEWMSGDYDAFLFYSVFNYSGIGYYPVSFWLGGTSFEMPTSWWDILAPGGICLWAVIGVDTSSGDWELSDACWFMCM